MRGCTQSGFPARPPGNQGWAAGVTAGGCAVTGAGVVGVRGGPNLDRGGFRLLRLVLGRRLLALAALAPYQDPPAHRYGGGEQPPLDHVRVVERGVLAAGVRDLLGAAALRAGRRLLDVAAEDR